MLAFIETINEETIHDEEQDPLIGFFAGPPDLAEQSEEILHNELGNLKSRNTQEE